MTMEEQQRWFSDYGEEFNHERPHEALAGGMATLEPPLG